MGDSGLSTADNNPEYAAKVIAIMDQYNLYRYDD